MCCLCILWGWNQLFWTVMCVQLRGCVCVCVCVSCVFLCTVGLLSCVMPPINFLTKGGMCWIVPFWCVYCQAWVPSAIRIDGGHRATLLACYTRVKQWELHRASFRVNYVAVSVSGAEDPVIALCHTILLSGKWCCHSWEAPPPHTTKLAHPGRPHICKCSLHRDSRISGKEPH